MAISKLHILLALSGVTAVVVPTTTVLMLNSKKNSIKVCKAPDATTKPYLYGLYKKMVLDGTTSGTTPDPTKLKKWEGFMKNWKMDCQGNSLGS